MTLYVDPARESRDNTTGIYVRAFRSGGRACSTDVACLNKASLLEWLRSKGGDNRLAENTVGVLLGHGHLHDA